MKLHHESHATWPIAGLVLAFAAVQAWAWYAAGGLPTTPGDLAAAAGAWITILVLAAVSLRRIGSLSRRLSVNQERHLHALDEVEQLQMQNAMLRSIAGSVDVPLAFQELAGRIARLVPCDRVGLTLLSEDGPEFQTYTVRVGEGERRARPRPEVMFRVDRTLLGLSLIHI